MSNPFRALDGAPPSESCSWPPIDLSATRMSTFRCCLLARSLAAPTYLLGSQPDRRADGQSNQGRAIPPPGAAARPDGSISAETTDCGRAKEAPAAKKYSGGSFSGAAVI